MYKIPWRTNQSNKNGFVDIKDILILRHWNLFFGTTNAIKNTIRVNNQMQDKHIGTNNKSNTYRLDVHYRMAIYLIIVLTFLSIIRPINKSSLSAMTSDRFLP